jgi:hypothetical protein
MSGLGVVGMVTFLIRDRLWLHRYRVELEKYGGVCIGNIVIETLPHRCIS